MNEVDNSWFPKARFGLFSHVGIYSLLGRGEWALNREGIPVDEIWRQGNEFAVEEVRHPSTHVVEARRAPVHADSRSTPAVGYEPNWPEVNTYTPLPQEPGAERYHPTSRAAR